MTDGVVGCGVRVGGNDGNPKKAESHLRRSESTQGAPGVQGGLFGVQEGAVGSQEVAGKWRCMNDFSQKVEDFSRFFEIGSFRPWRRRRWSRLAERSPKPVSPTKTDKGKWVSDDTRKIRRFSRRTCPPGYWPVTHPGLAVHTISRTRPPKWYNQLQGVVLRVPRVHNLSMKDHFLR